MLTVELRGKNRQRLGRLPYTKLTVELRHLGVSTWLLEMDPGAGQAALIEPGCGVIIKDGTRTLLSGPMRKPQRKAAPDAPVKTLVLSGCDDTYRLSRLTVYPDPTLNAESQTTQAYDVRSGVGETVMKAYVNANAGPGALLARRVPGLVVAADAGRGGSVSESARWDNLGDLLIRLGTKAELGFTVTQSGTDLVYDVYEPQDRSAQVRFSREVGNLGDYSYELAGPNATVAIVLGGGEGTARTVVERVNAAAESDWGERAEVVVDRRDTTDATILAQAGDEALAKEGPTAAFAFTPIETPNMRFGVDYGLGDIVSVDTDGVRTVDVVRGARITSDEMGLVTRPIVGSDGATSPDVPKLYAYISELFRQVHELQRRV